MQNVAIPTRLLEQAKAQLGTRSARAAVVQALEQIIKAKAKPAPKLQSVEAKAEARLKKGTRSREFEKTEDFVSWIKGKSA